MQKILIVGGGGREHSLGWKLSQSKEISEVLYAPGNAGTKEEKGRNIPINSTKKENFPELLDLIKSENIDLTLIGPEAPLADGLMDYLNSSGYNRVFGPTKEATKLESDKFFSCDLMKKLNIPQAKSIKCYSTNEAIKAIHKLSTKEGIVLKARGLTGGKGVIVCDSKEQALVNIVNHAKKYGQDVLIAERLFGEEFSVFGISDGKKVLPLEISIQDHKPLLDKDKGPNTGGMGAYAPASVANVDMVKYIAENIMTPIVQTMANDGVPYKGLLYGGMIMTNEGPKVLEFNVRFGDPESQPAMMMIKSDLYEVLSLALEGNLYGANIEFKPGASCCVVLASKGYPKKYKKGLKVSGLKEANSIKNVKVFHAGTKTYKDSILTAGGRILGVTSYSPKGIKEAQKIAYKAVSKIKIEGGFYYRKDIADKALKYDKDNWLWKPINPEYC